MQPGSQELMEVQERGRLPKDEKQLHALLMAEGDLTAGELDIPIEWLENLAKDGRVLYLEQGLWIAAEQEEEYKAALQDDTVWQEAADKQKAVIEQGMAGQIHGQDERLHIVRRMLRYRGDADVTQTALRYGWPERLAEEILDQLCRQAEAVKQDGRYYHAKLYSRARVRTLKNRREEIRTCPPENYAALMLSQTESGAPAQECLRNTLRQYAGMRFPAAYWEKIILPKRVRNYRESMLDTYLAGGELFWHMEDRGEVRFDDQEEIDWNADVSVCVTDDPAARLTEKEQTIYNAILKRGACFMQSLNGLLVDESPYDTLLSLMEKGLVYADSFLPVRQWLDREKTKKAVARQRINIRVKALQVGRWDIVRPVRRKPSKRSWRPVLTIARFCVRRPSQHAVFRGRKRCRYFVYGSTPVRREEDILWKVCQARSLSAAEIMKVWCGGFRIRNGKLSG